jgi:predicted transcriptional regulator
MNAGHSNTYQKKLAEYRRDQVFRLSSMGYSQPKIANILNVSQSLISLDIALIRQRAKEAMSDYLENKLPLIFQESMTGISDVISQTWEIINNPNTSQHDRLHALSLVADCNERRLDIASNGSIVEDGIRFVQEAKHRLVTIAAENTKEILHEEEHKQEEQRQQPSQQYSQTKNDNNNSANDNDKDRDDNRRRQTTNSVF